MTSVPPEFEVVSAVESRNRALSGNALAIGSMLFWAAGFPAAEILLDDWHPLGLMVLRLSMALAVLFPLWLLMDGPQAVLRAAWVRGLWIGMIGFGTGTNLLLMAQWFTDPVTVALVATTTPIAATLVEVIGRQRRVTRRFLVGLSASVAGGAIVVGGNLSADVGWGLLMAVAAGFFFSWASHVTVKQLPELSPTGRSTVTFVGAGVFTAGIFSVAWGMGIAELPNRISPNQLGLLAIYSVAAMALAQILFIASVGKLGIALSSFHMNIAPFYVMLILIALGGAWDWRAALGAAVVGIGVLISQSKGASHVR